ncbi:MAG: hypothetical protein LBI85_08010 [Spirochaetaceae bacterium]|jgi:hypothetical protein|nr:hypothetical protein [Spirochaetaceae bacterium]
MLIMTGYFKDNTVIPYENVSIPDGTKAVITMEDAAGDEAREAARQLPVFKTFFSKLDEITGELPPEFDEIMAKGLSFNNAETL